MRLLVLASILFIASCSPKEEVPTDLMPRDTFTEVLLQAHLIEAGPTTASDSTWDALFHAQGTDKKRFQETYTWYAQHPAELKAVYNEVLTRLQQRVDRPDSTVVHQ